MSRIFALPREAHIFQTVTEGEPRYLFSELAHAYPSTWPAFSFEGAMYEVDLAYLDEDLIVLVKPTNRDIPQISQQARIDAHFAFERSHSHRV
jgi:hypothetical protein